jgi:Spy/CpxP family protein refolding chaperone
MKQLISSLFITGLLATLAAGQTTTRTPPDPATIAQRRVQMLTNFLGLNAAQQQQATTIFTNSATANAAVNTSLRTERQSLETAIQTNNSASIDQIAAAIGNLTTQITSNDAKADAALYLILNAEQQTKFSKSLSRGPGLMGGAFGRARPQ